MMQPTRLSLRSPRARPGILLVAAVLALAWSSEVAASPPGAEGDVCEEAGLPGALQGLCHAYCESLDCDGDGPRGSATACAALERNFLRSSGGAPLPCQVAVCPCFSAAEVAALARTLDDEAIYETLRCVDRRPGKPITAVAAQRIDGAACSPGSNDCSALAVEFTEDSACELNTPAESRSLSQITEGERQACRAAVLEGAEAAGLACN